MKKSVSIIIVVVIVVAAAVGAVLLMNKRSSNNTMPNMTNMGISSNSSSVATDAVSISNFTFSPKAITIKKGTTVARTNHDSVAHTVVETDGKRGPNSQSIDSGKFYSFTYNNAGTFAYQCSIHPEMTGTVTVTQ